MRIVSAPCASSGRLQTLWAQPTRAVRSRHSVSAAKKDDSEAALNAVAALGQIVKPGWVDLLAGAVSATSTAKRPGSKELPAPPDWKSPVYALIAVQVAGFLLCNILDVLPAAALGLNLKNLQWWQLLTSGFAFSSWQHLAESVFLTYVFGRLLERAHGAWGLWLALLASIIGANSFAAWLLPPRVPMPCFATTAGMFGLCVSGLLLPRLLVKPLEVACLMPFVVSAMMSQYLPLASHLLVQSVKVGHLVHLAGAFVGAGMAWAILSALETYKRKVEQEKEEKERQERAKRQQEQATKVAQALGTAAKAATDVAKKLF